MINSNNDMFIDPGTINLREVSIELIDILMDVFTEFEEGLKPWDKNTFINKCNEAYMKMPSVNKSALLKMFN
jgi:hypothetical protein